MNMQRKIPLIVLSAAALAAVAYLAMREPEQLVPTAQVSRNALEVSFTEEGKTRIKERYAITTPVTGTLRRISLQAGDAVHAGQVLAEIEPAAAALLDPRARSQAEAELRGAQAALTATRQRSSAAQAAHQLAQTELERLRPLQASGAASREQYDQARTRASTTRAELAAARAEERIAQERIQAARAQLDAGNGSTGDSTRKALPITAPVDGRILRRTLQSSTPVTAGQELMEIGNPAELEMEVHVLSSDAVQLRQGMPARVQRWGGDEVLQARITRVEPGGFTKTSALGVEEQRTRVILDFTSPHEQWSALGDAYRVEVQFITRQAEQALQIPGNALFRNSDGWAVYRVEEGRARLTPVQIGMRSATAAEVLDGLQEGQTIIIQPDDKIRDGARVRSGDK